MSYPHLLFVLLLAATISGCGGDKKRARPKIGEFTATAQTNMKKAVYYEDCEVDQYEAMLKVTQFFDSHADKIKAQIQNSAKSQPNNGYSIGPLYVQKTEMPLTQVTWKHRDFSWTSILAWIEKPDSTRDLPYLSRVAARMLEDDYERTFYGDGYYISFWNLDVLRALEKRVSSCIQNECSDLSLLEQEQKLVDSSYVYRVKWKFYSQDRSMQRLKNFHSFLEFDVKTHKNFTLKAVRRVSATRLEVSIDPGPLRGHERELERLFLKPWTSKNLSVGIRWTSRAKEKQSFLIAVSKPNRTSRVHQSNLTINLSSGLKDVVFAHEFGHTLGLRDEYFHYFDIKSCGYQEWYQEGNIMSENTPNVLPSHWTELDRLYPWQPQ